MRAHQFDENGVIINTIEVDDLGVFPNLVDAGLGGSIGDSVINGQVVPKPAPVIDLAAEKSAAIAKTYKDTDAIYEEKIGNRQSEYDMAELAAREYAAAGYAGAVSDYISGYAQSNATGQVQTAQWAADQILAQATALRGAQVLLRNTRFDAQKAMRAASTKTELDAVVANWNTFIAAVRAQLGV